jgi:hypothetical protein
MFFLHLKSKKNYAPKTYLKNYRHMPNQRDPDKRLLNAWVNKDELSHYRKIASDQGKTLTDWVLDVLEKQTGYEPPSTSARSKTEHPSKP